LTGVVGKTIVVRARKYDGSEHRSWPAQVLSQEGSLIVLDAKFSDEVIHDLLGTIASGTHSLEYYWLDRWYNIFRFAQADGKLRNYYCNVNVPAALKDDVLSYVDLDIDILVQPDFSYQILDLDEFEKNAELYDYSFEVEQNAHLAVSELVEMIETRTFPFGAVARP
jgi:protein associated with RNAse G/E